MTTIRCPALRSDDTLGFLTALGLLELCTSTLPTAAPRLGWEGVGGAALLDVPIATMEELTHHLHAVATELAASDRVLPCANPGPVRKPDSGAERRGRRESGEAVKLDPASLSAEEAIRVYGTIRDVEVSDHDRDSARWLAALVNQLSSARSGFRALTPLYSPSGQMTLHQLYRDHLAAVVNELGLLGEALTGWRRRPGETGGNLDSRALNDAASATSGKAENSAVVGASWLALMAVPLFPQVSGRRPRAVGWELAKGGPCLRWPIWTAPLDRPAVEVLLSHPALEPPDPRRHDDPPTVRSPLPSKLRILGVEAICRSHRRALNNSAGALRPPTVTPVP